MSETANINDTVTVNYSVTNTSGKALQGQWTDSLFISHDNVFGNEDDILLAEKNINTQVASNSSYNGTFNVTVPQELLKGDYHLFVKTDNGDSVSETDNSDNIKHAAINITRNFKLEINRVGEGQISLQIQSPNQQTPQSPNIIETPYSGVFEDGTIVFLKALPTENWHFSSWTGNISSNENPIEFTVNSSLLATAKSSDEDGTSDTGPPTSDPGPQITVTFKPILTNPLLTAVPKDKTVDLAWNPIEDHGILKQYNIYVSETSFNNVSTMTPHASIPLLGGDQGVGSSFLNSNFSILNPGIIIDNLVNDSTYHFAVTS